MNEFSRNGKGARESDERLNQKGVLQCQPHRTKS